MCAAPVWEPVAASVNLKAEAVIVEAEPVVVEAAPFVEQPAALINGVMLAEELQAYLYQRLDEKGIGWFFPYFLGIYKGFYQILN